MTKLSVADRIDRLHSKLRDHPFHPRHSLWLSPDDGVLFRCNGCKLPGAGARYQCGRRTCDVDLHLGCALAPREREIGGFTFYLLYKKPADGRVVVCDVCREDAPGFVYHGFQLGQNLHPYCPEAFELAGLSFELCRKAPPGRRCNHCNKKIRIRRCPCRGCHGRDAWYYLCRGADASLHLKCAKELASKGFANLPLEEACYRAVAYATKAAGDRFTVVSKSNKDVVTVSAQALIPRKDSLLVCGAMAA